MMTSNDIGNENFENWMRPKLRAYYDSKIDYLRKVVGEIAAPQAGPQFLKVALGKDSDELSSDSVDISMYQPMRQYLKVSGKLFRPLLTCIFIEGYGKNADAYKPILAISEIIHSSSLILDDIADASLLRRGSTCSHLIYGIPRAANASCTMTFYVFRLLQSPLLSLTTEIKNKLYEVLLWEHYVTNIGSALDLGWAYEKRNNTTEEEFIQHILFRSCSYTYRHAAQIGAIVAGANTKNIEIIFQYCSLLGLAFQLIDDILNLKPALETWGKTIGEDLTEGKRSLLVLYCLKIASISDRNRLLEILDGKVMDQLVLKEAITILEKYQVFEYVMNKAKKFINDAIRVLDEADLNEEYKLLLQEFALYVVERKI